MLREFGVLQVVFGIQRLFDGATLGGVLAPPGKMAMIYRFDRLPTAPDS